MPSNDIFFIFFLFLIEQITIVFDIPKFSKKDKDKKIWNNI